MKQNVLYETLVYVGYLHRLTGRWPHLNPIWATSEVDLIVLGGCLIHLACSLHKVSHKTVTVTSVYDPVDQRFLVEFTVHYFFKCTAHIG